MSAEQWKSTDLGISIAWIVLIVGLAVAMSGCARTGFGPVDEVTPEVEQTDTTTTQANYTETVRCSVLVEPPCWPVTTCDDPAGEVFPYWICHWVGSTLYQCAPPARLGSYLTIDQLWDAQDARELWIYDNGLQCDGTVNLCKHLLTYNAQALPVPGP